MRPHVIFNSAMSLDGKVEGQQGIELLNRLDKHRIHELRGSMDAILVDVDTIIENDPALDVRKAEGPEPDRIIVDPKAEIPLKARVLEGEWNKIIAVSSAAPRKRTEKLKRIKRLEIIRSGEFTVNLPELLSKLYERGIRSLMLEGGGGLPSRMFNEDFIDEIYIEVLPILVGKGRELFEKNIDSTVKLDLEGILQYGDQVVLHYLVKR